MKKVLVGRDVDSILIHENKVEIIMKNDQDIIVVPKGEHGATAWLEMTED